tara:strand:- start:632 stop:886 length:255 start_codon:yes stop_codon:yes gene_type:complete
MKKSKITDYIFLLLNKIRPLKIKKLKKSNDFDYFDSGHLDSFEFIKFNMQLEHKFKIKFSPKELTSKKYKTISGLTDIIYKKLI